MLLVSKDYKRIINLEQVSDIGISCGETIEIKLDGYFRIATCESEKDAETLMRSIVDAYAKGIRVFVL